MREIKILKELKDKVQCKNCRSTMNVEKLSDNTFYCWFCGNSAQSKFIKKETK